MPEVSRASASSKSASARLEAPVERVSEGSQIVEGLSQGVHNDPSCARLSPISTADAHPRPLD